MNYLFLLVVCQSFELTANIIINKVQIDFIFENTIKIGKNKKKLLLHLRCAKEKNVISNRFVGEKRIIKKDFFKHFLRRTTLKAVKVLFNTAENLTISHGIKLSANNLFFVVDDA